MIEQIINFNDKESLIVGVFVFIPLILFYYFAIFRPILKIKRKTRKIIQKYREGLIKK